MRGSDAKLTEPRSEIDCCPSQGESATPWLANLVRGIAVSMDHLGLEGAVFEDALPRVRKQCQTTKPMSALRRRPQQHPESWPSPRNPFLFEALVVMTKDRQTQEQKASPEKKLAKQRPSGGQGKCPSQNMSNSATRSTCCNSRPARETWTKRKPRGSNRHCWRNWPEAGERAQHMRDQNSAQRRGQGGAGVLPGGCPSRDPGLAGFQDRPGEGNTTTGSLPAE